MDLQHHVKMLVNVIYHIILLLFNVIKHLHVIPKETLTSVLKVFCHVREKFNEK